MDRKELVEVWGVDENAILLDPASFFDKGIVGVTEDKQHVIYSYQKITAGNASEEFMKKEKMMKELLKISLLKLVNGLIITPLEACHIWMRNIDQLS